MLADGQDEMSRDLGMDDFQYATKEYMPGLTAKPWCVVPSIDSSIILPETLRRFEVGVGGHVTLCALKFRFHWPC